MLENQDATDRTYWDYNGNLVGGDYATSNQYKPKFTLSLNDKILSKLELVKEINSYASRIHGEARWTDTYSKRKIWNQYRI